MVHMSYLILVIAAICLVAEAKPTSQALEKTAEEHDEDKSMDSRISNMMVKATKFEAIKQIVEAAASPSDDEHTAQKRIFCNSDGCGEWNDD